MFCVIFWLSLISTWSMTFPLTLEGLKELWVYGEPEQDDNHR